MCICILYIYPATYIVTLVYPTHVSICFLTSVLNFWMLLKIYFEMCVFHCNLSNLLTCKVCMLCDLKKFSDMDIRKIVAVKLSGQLRLCTWSLYTPQNPVHACCIFFFILTDFVQFPGLETHFLILTCNLLKKKKVVIHLSSFFFSYIFSLVLWFLRM